MCKLKEVIISVTNRCNSSCIMCDIPKAPPQELSLDLIKQIIDDAAVLGATTIVFSGGEPMLKEDIFSLVHYAHKKNISACITSNGILIDEEAAFRLSHSGVNVVNISLEGPRDIHDSLRGKGSFDKALDALKNLAKAGVETTIATVISRYNYKYLLEVASMALEENVTTLKFQPFSDLFLSPGNPRTEYFLLSQEEAAELAAIMERVVEVCQKNTIATNPYFYLKKIPVYLSGRLSLEKKTCNALWNSCPIDFSGKVYPCWVLNQDRFLIGDLKKERLLNIWGSERHHNIREKICQNGCRGCMMSCYDEVYGTDGIEQKISASLKSVGSRGLSDWLKVNSKKLLKKVKFYSSYRGGTKRMIKRIYSSLQRINPDYLLDERAEIKSELKNLENAKILLDKQKRDKNS